MRCTSTGTRWLALLLVAVAAGCVPDQRESLGTEESFETLFDGRNLEGWKQSGNWVIQDDGSVVRKKRGGSLEYVARKIPDDFELRFEWKVGKGRNSGLYYRPTQY